ncbi:phenylacetic acid degradation operon negative regulatory [Chlorella sorokiniana]|uniref:Phenylacetic acid degradation operon negative regulatory n=1 Tax=Chlorella sorokiniana TaxID=3076 RepID=A0A2P6TG20_CHLSO|nr:phenylacetic acid degradation operon negative regulatory [Chlorella sorokiniana]|eukprot:PRW33054.1 phenylacetic acid degradation operon negative regulatory [Chlorella sorokiniana]
MALTHRLLRALADRPEELALLLRSEYRPRQTLLHHAAAVGDAALIDSLLAYDPSLARLDLNKASSCDWYHHPPATALAAAILALQPAAIRALLPHSWPPLLRTCEQQASSGPSSSPSSPASQPPAQKAPQRLEIDDSWSPGAFQACMLSLLLRVVANYDGWPPAGCFSFSDWSAKLPQPAPPDWRQRVEATLEALLHGPHGLDINQSSDPQRSALATAVLYCPPWAAHLMLSFKPIWALPLQLVMTYVGYARYATTVCSHPSLHASNLQPLLHAAAGTLDVAALVLHPLLPRHGTRAHSDIAECASIIVFMQFCACLLTGLYKMHEEQRLFELHQWQRAQRGLPLESGWDARVYGVATELLQPWGRVSLLWGVLLALILWHAAVALQSFGLV